MNRQTMLAVTMVALLAIAPGALAQRTFATPEDAAQALLDAGKADDLTALEAIFGPGSEVVLSSGDPVDDANERKWFVTKASEKMTIEYEDDEWAVVAVGESAWPFAIPLHKENGGWVFDLDEGEQELLDRRIGNNELVTISVMRAYVDAQREYAAEDPDGDGVGNYARRILSTEGRRDGLYYPTDEDEEASPLGELVAQASARGYQTTSDGGERAPYEGYRYKVLTEQGSHAPGGAMSYEEDGELTRGFALLAWPATYGVSGVKSFIVNQLVIVFEKDLGPETATVASAIAAYDPDRTWSPSAD